MKLLRWVAVPVLASISLSACSGQTTKAIVNTPTPTPDQASLTQPSSAPPVAASPTITPSPKKPADEAFEAYMDDVINQGGDGLSRWCQGSQRITSQFYAPRSYKLLKKEINEPKKVAVYVFQMDSSNKGGQQITANWVLFLERKGASNWCVSYVGEKN